MAPTCCGRPKEVTPSHGCTGPATLLLEKPIAPPFSDRFARKGALRRQARLRRAEAQEPGFAEAVAAQAPAFEPDAVIGGYFAIGTELDPAPLLRKLAAAGHSLGLPTVTDPEQFLSFRAYRPGDPLRAGPHGTREPGPEAPEIRPSVLLVPLLAFDREGFRLGYGGGYYDRTLRALRAAGPLLAIGLAYGFQEIAAVPHDVLDERLDMVVTEKGITRFGTGG